MAPVVTAAAWALWRPARLELTVPSLDLWQRAVEALARSDRRSTRRVSLSWWCLLTGAILAVLALAQPVQIAERPQRRLAIGVVPSYELTAGDPQARPWVQPVETILNRLASNDRVQLLLPAPLGGAGEWISPSEARAQVAKLPPLPARADERPLPAASPEAQQTVIFRFLPAPDKNGRIVQLVGEKRQGGAAAIDAHLRDAGLTELFVRLPAAGADVHLRTMPSGEAIALPDKRPTSDTLTAIVPQAEAYEIRINGWPTYLARQPRPVLRVAVVGRASDALRRYVQADALLQPTSQGEAELVIAVGVEPPADKPALVLMPPSPPTGWQGGEVLQNIALANADAAADSPLLRDVNLPGMAVRRARAWRAAAPGLLTVRNRSKAVLSVADQALAVYRAGDDEQPRRIDLAFDISQINTNIDQSDGFLILLANAMRWLAGDVQPTDDYGYLHPTAAVGWRDWQALTTSPDAAGPLPWPGVFRDRSGRLRAVCITGVQAVMQTTDPQETMAAMQLPEPAPAEVTIAYWPWLAAAAGALWILGWGFRIEY